MGCVWFFPHLRASGFVSFIVKKNFSVGGVKYGCLHVRVTILKILQMEWVKYAFLMCVW